MVMTILIWATDQKEEGPDWVLLSLGKFICKVEVTWYSLQRAATEAA